MSSGEIIDIVLKNKNDMTTFQTSLDEKANLTGADFSGNVTTIGEVSAINNISTLSNVIGANLITIGNVQMNTLNNVTKWNPNITSTPIGVSGNYLINSFLPQYFELKDTITSATSPITYNLPSYITPQNIISAIIVNETDGIIHDDASGVQCRFTLTFTPPSQTVVFKVTKGTGGDKLFTFYLTIR